MDKVRFQELQYLTLRKEIEDSLNRSFQIMVGGATLVPILVGIVGHYAATPILMTLPMMVVVIALLFGLSHIPTHIWERYIIASLTLTWCMLSICSSQLITSLQAS